MKNKLSELLAEATPGIWIVDDRHIHCSTGLTYPKGEEPETDVVVVVDTSCHKDGLLTATDKANLRLIAYMRNTCEELVEAAQLVLDYDDNKTPDSVDLCTVMERLRAAVEAE